MPFIERKTSILTNIKSCIFEKDQKWGCIGLKLQNLQTRAQFIPRIYLTELLFVIKANSNDQIWPY